MSKQQKCHNQKLENNGQMPTHASLPHTKGIIASAFKYTLQIEIQMFGSNMKKWLTEKEIQTAQLRMRRQRAALTIQKC